jgi:hypothetical protein
VYDAAKSLNLAIIMSAQLLIIVVENSSLEILFEV